MTEALAEAKTVLQFWSLNVRNGSSSFDDVVVRFILTFWIKSFMFTSILSSCLAIALMFKDTFFKYQYPLLIPGNWHSPVQLNKYNQRPHNHLYSLPTYTHIHSLMHLRTYLYMVFNVDVWHLWMWKHLFVVLKLSDTVCYLKTLSVPRPWVVLVSSCKV